MEETERKERRLKRFLWIPIVIIILLVGFLTFVVAARLFTPEDTWICQNGEWIEHGKPSAAKPTLECKKKEVSEKTTTTNSPTLPNINPVSETHDAVNDLPSENPIGPVQIKGFFSFIAPVVDIAADLGAKVCQWGRPPEIANTCPSIKVEFQRFFESQTK